MNYFLTENCLMDILLPPAKLLNYMLGCYLYKEERPPALRVMYRMLKYPNIYFKHHLFSLAQLNKVLDKASYGSIHISAAIAGAKKAHKEGKIMVISSFQRFNGTVYVEYFMVQSDKLTHCIRQKTIDEILETI